MYNVAKTFVENALKYYRKRGKHINIAHPNAVCIEDVRQWVGNDILSRIHRGCNFPIKDYVIIMNVNEDSFMIDGMINGINEGLENEKGFDVIVTKEEFIEQLCAMLIFYEEKNEMLSVSTFYEDDEYYAKDINKFFRKVRK
jgi:hypothetical protein